MQDAKKCKDYKKYARDIRKILDQGDPSKIATIDIKPIKPKLILGMSESARISKFKDLK